MEVLGDTLRPRLVLLTNLAREGLEPVIASFARLCERATAGSILVILRDPELSVRERLAAGTVLRQVTRASGQYLSVRDRLDLALVLHADGLHLSEASPPAARFRPKVPSRFWISRAVHDLELPAPEDVDAVLLSPVCAPRKNRSPIGLLGLADYTSRNATTHVTALGGIDASSAGHCLASGASSVAVMGAALAEEPAALLSALGILA